MTGKNLVIPDVALAEFRNLFEKLSAISKKIDSCIRRNDRNGEQG
jgi:hypothetical protein